MSPERRGRRALGLAVFVALAAGFVRFPSVVPLVMVALAPFRLPFDFRRDNRFFIGLGESGALGTLDPALHGLAAAAGALVWRFVRGEDARRFRSIVAAPAALFVALMSLSLLWARDDFAAASRLAFFVLPFAVLLTIVAYAPFRAWLPRVLAIEAIALGCLFAVVGIAEAWTHNLLFYEPKLVVANSYTSYFRVTSLFSDPSIYARHLVLALTLLVVVILLARAPVSSAPPRCVDLGRASLLLLAVGHGRARGRDGSRHGSRRRPPRPRLMAIAVVGRCGSRFRRVRHARLATTQSTAW